jgi:hypothetical protein
MRQTELDVAAHALVLSTHPQYRHVARSPSFPRYNDSREQRPFEPQAYSVLRPVCDILARDYE